MQLIKYQYFTKWSYTIVYNRNTILNNCKSLPKIGPLNYLLYDCASTCMIVQVSENHINFNKKTPMKNSFFLTTIEFDLLFCFMLNDIVWKILELKQKK